MVSEINFLISEVSGREFGLDVVIWEIPHLIIETPNRRLALRRTNIRYAPALVMASAKKGKVSEQIKKKTLGWVVFGTLKSFVGLFVA